MVFPQLDIVSVPAREHSAFETPGGWVWDQAPRPPGTRNHETGGVWVFRTVCFERFVLSSPGRLRPGRMDDHEEVFEAHA